MTTVAILLAMPVAALSIGVLLGLVAEWALGPFATREQFQLPRMPRPRQLQLEGPEKEKGTA